MHLHRCVTFEQDGQPIGFAYFAPTPMTDRTWHLWWIVVGKQIQARGVGSQLLHYVEESRPCRKRPTNDGRDFGIAFLDLTRRFYVKHGYDRAATLKDFYAAGHDMVIYPQTALRRACAARGTVQTPCSQGMILKRLRANHGKLADPDTSCRARTKTAISQVNGNRHASQRIAR